MRVLAPINALIAASVIANLSPNAFGASSPPSGPVFILGDDNAVGTAANPRFTLDPVELVREMASPSSNPTTEPTRRAWPAFGDFTGSFDWVTDALRTSLAAVFLESPTDGALTRLAQSLGHSPLETIVAARTGDTAASAVAQLRRALLVTNGQLPTRVLAQFGMSDACLGGGVPTPAADFELDVTNLLDAINALPSKDPIEIILVPSPSLTTVLSAPDVLEKRTLAAGRSMSCRDYRRQVLSLGETPIPNSVSAATATLLRRLSLVPVATCPAAFIDPDSPTAAALVTRMANTLRDYNEALARVASEHAKRLPKIRVRWLPKAADLSFGPADVAADCVHLSARGHQRVLEALQANPG